MVWFLLALILKNKTAWHNQKSLLGLCRFSPEV